MDTLHQLWIGGSLPERNRPWCDSMRAMAAGLGCSYRLDGWQFILARYQGNPVLPILQELLDFLPIGTAASLISDWFRLRVLADEGGLYCDTDFSANTVPAWRPSADLALFHERAAKDRLATGFTWCNGARGRAACQLMADAVEARLLEKLGSPADCQFRARAVNLLRMDRPGGAGMSLVHFIGPAYARKVLLPMLAAHGYTTEGVPREVAFNWHQRRFLPGTAKPSVWHFGFATWRRKGGWPALAKAAQEHGQAMQRRQEGVATLEGGKVLHVLCTDATAPLQAWQDAAAAMGWTCQPWTLADLRLRYSLRHAAAAFGYFPQDVATTFALGLYRLAVLAEFGGVWLDADVTPQNVAKLAAYEPAEDLLLYDNSKAPRRFGQSVIWCRGQRGQQAAKVLLGAFTARLHNAFPLHARNAGARLADALRLNRWPNMPRFSLGPARTFKQVQCLASRAGFTVGVLPAEVAGTTEGAALRHAGTMPWCWAADWFTVEGLAENMDSALASAMDAQAAPVMDSTPTENAQEGTRSALLERPAHLRPQGVAKLPGRPHRKPVQPAPLPLVQPVEKPGADVLATIRVPRGLRRIVIFSNVTAGFPDFPLQPGDWCIHINTGRHIDAALQQRGTRHALFVRHGKNPKTKRRCWYTPPSFEGMEQVVFINDGMPAQRLPWWRQYLADNPGRCPTSGWIVANLLRTLAPRVPLFLLGFDPAEKHGTPRWKGHAWDYEAAWYTDKKFNVIKPTT